MGRPRILIVDDEEGVLQTLRLSFDRYAWTVETATSAEQALELHRKSAFDVLVVDKNLPGMTGVELVRELRRKHDRVAVLLMTGFASTESAVETLNLGIEAYLEKPFANIFEVGARVSAVVTRTRTVATLRQARSTAASTRTPSLAAGSASKPGLVQASGMASDPANSPVRGDPVSRETSNQFRVVVATPQSKVGQQIATDLGLPPATTHVKHATTTIEVRAFLRRTPDLVILHGLVDLLAAVEAVRSQSPATACIVLLENPGLSAVTRMVDLKVNALITHPPEHPQFQKRLAAIVRRLRTAKQRSDALGPEPD